MKYWTMFIQWFYLMDETFETEEDTITNDIIKINNVINSVSSESQYESCRRYINLLPGKYYYNGDTISPSKRDRTIGLYLISKDACKKLTKTLNAHYEKLLLEVDGCNCDNCCSNNPIVLS